MIKLAGTGDVQGMGINSSGKMTDVNIAGLSKEEAANIQKGNAMTFLCKGSVDEVLGGAHVADCSVDVQS